MKSDEQDGHPLVDTGLGYSLYIDPMDSFELQSHGTYEPAEVDVCRRLLRPGQRVLDIGANMGYFSVLFSRLVGAAGQVFAFEPDADALQLLGKNLRLNHADNVSVLPLALGEHSGRSTLYRCPFNVGMHRMYPSVCCDDEGLAVRIGAGDDLALGRIDFIKIDIEGYELPALRGLERTLRANPQILLLAEFSPLAMMEAGYHPRDHVRFLRSLDFRALAQSGPAWQPVDWGELERATAVFDSANFGAFRARARGTDKFGLWQATEQYLAEIRYARPYYENLVIAGPQAALPSL